MTKEEAIAKLESLTASADQYELLEKECHSVAARFGFPIGGMRAIIRCEDCKHPSNIGDGKINCAMCEHLVKFKYNEEGAEHAITVFCEK